MVSSKKSSVSSAILVAAAATTVSAHSWVVCTDYRGVKQPTVFDPAVCKGWTRNAQQYVSGVFGADMGLDTQQQGCKQVRSASNYNTQYPMATWTPGQEVCMIWPSKNHVASSNNIHIPDGGVKVFAVPYGTADPANNAGFSAGTLVADFGASPYGSALTNPNSWNPPRPGFQNCPGFLTNSDKAVCSQCFTVPNLPAGKYAMQWQWLFNPGTDPYTNCFDIEVVGDGPTPTSAKVTTTSKTSTTSQKISTTSQKISTTSRTTTRTTTTPSPMTTTSPTPIPGATFVDGFENGLGNWALTFPSCSGTGTAAIDNTVSYSGSSSLKITGGGGYCNHVFMSNKAIASVRPKAYARFFIRHSTLIPSNHITFIGMTDANDGNQDLRMGGQNQRLAWNRQSDDATCPSQSPVGILTSVVLPTNKWTCMELEIDTANGYIKAYIDETEVPGLTVQNGVSDIDQQWKTSKPNWKPSPQDLKLGWESYGGDADTIWYDDVAIGSSRIGCGSVPSPTSAAKTTTTTTTQSPLPTGACVALNNQCGGILYTGSTTCCSGTCTYKSTYYSQCL